jgi:hypothetical protein
MRYRQLYPDVDVPYQRHGHYIRSLVHQRTRHSVTATTHKIETAAPTTLYGGQSTPISFNFITRMACRLRRLTLREQPWMRPKSCSPPRFCSPLPDQRKTARRIGHCSKPQSSSCNQKEGISECLLLPTPAPVRSRSRG